jgi:hypothetical protein
VPDDYYSYLFGANRFVFFDCFRMMFICHMLQDGFYLKVKIIEL